MGKSQIGADEVGRVIRRMDKRGEELIGEGPQSLSQHYLRGAALDSQSLSHHGGPS